MEYKDQDYIRQLNQDSGTGLYLKLQRMDNEEEEDFVDKWNDYEFLSPFISVIESFLSALENNPSNTQLLRDCCANMHDVFKGYDLQRIPVISDANLPGNIVNILHNNRNHSGLLLVALYVACDLTRSTHGYTEELLSNGFYDELIFILNNEKSLTFSWGKEDKKKYSLSEAIMVCLNNIMLTPNCESVISANDIVFICRNRDNYPLLITLRHIAKFLSLYTREKVDNIEIATQIGRVSAILVYDNDSHKIKDLIHYTGITLCNLLRTKSIDPSALNFDEIQELCNVGIEKKTESIMNFLFLMSCDYIEHLSKLELNYGMIFKLSFTKKKKSFLIRKIALSLLSTILLNMPNLVISNPTIIEITNNLPEIAMKENFDYKCLLGDFINNFVISATSDLLLQSNILNIIEFLECFIDDSIDAERFSKILQAVMKYSKLISSKKVYDTSVSAELDEAVSQCMDYIDYYDSNETIKEFKEMFPQEED